MTLATEWVEHVERNLRGIEAFSPGVCHACETCNPDSLDEDTFNETVTEEGSFSWSECDSCDTNLGGDRYAAHGMVDDPGNPLRHFEICADCVAYHVNGDIPESDEE